MGINPFTRAMVGITGHHVDFNTRPEDIGGLSKIGLSICFASFLAALQFGIAGWFLAGNLDPIVRALVSFTTGLIGALVVLLIDRSFIYASDTRADSVGKLGYFYIAIRIFLILAIGSLSSQFVLPLLLKSELAIHIQDLKDNRYEAAKDRYLEKYNVQEKVSNEQSIRSSISKIRAELDNPPQSLVRQKLEAENCMLDYKRKVNSAIGPDVEFNEVANLFSADKTACDRLSVMYKEAYQGYFNPRKALLAQNQDAYGQAKEESNSAQAFMKTDLKHADETNQQFLNMSSSDVLWDLIKTNPGARTKYLLITIVQLVLELMPLLLKSLLGRSPLGIRVAMRMNALQEEYSNVELGYQLNSIERLIKVTNAQNTQRVNALDGEILIQEKKNHLMSLKADIRHKIFEGRQTPAFDWASIFGSIKAKKASANVKPDATEQSQKETRVDVKDDRAAVPHQYAPV
jgi:hypothetical protein